MLHAQGSITIRRRPKDGNPGADAVRYWLVPSVSQIKKTDDGKYHPTSITCEKRKQTGNSSPIATSEGTLKYQIGHTDNSTSTLTNYSSAITIPANCQWIKFVLYVNNVDVATETVSVVADGESVYLLDLDNEMQGIPCNSSGTPTISGTLASTNSTVYKGASIDTGWTFSKTDSGCTSSINASTGEVTVSAISADKASVTVTATKGSQSLSAVMSLYKVKAGADGKNGTNGTDGTNGTNGSNGESPVIYSIEASASAISRNSAGTLSPTSITAYKNKTVGSTTTRTTDKTLKYKRVGQDSTETTLNSEGGTIQSINSSCTAIELKLYDTDGTTILDSERVPIVKDGKNGQDGKDGQDGIDGIDGIDGEDAVTILVSPENIEFNLSNSVIKQTVKVNAYKGKKKLSYEENEFVCSTLTTTGSGTFITTGLRWNFEVDGADFYYTFMYIAGNDIDISIPFTVTVDSVKYERAIYVHTVKNGTQGIPGPTYKPLRVREWSEISNNTKLTTGLNDDDDWTDIVYILTDTVESGVKYWKCIKDFTKKSGQTPPGDSDTPSTNSLVGYLQKTSNFGSLATDIFLANYALIKNLGVETIDMRDSHGNVLFQAKNGNVICNTGNFQNVNVSGSLKASTLELKVSTENHNGDTSPEPNGSICLNADRILLPDLPAGSVRTIRVLNPLETRTAPNDLILSRGSTNVRISPTLSELDAEATQITLSEYGMNGGVYLELLGYKKANSSLTYWLTKKLADVL